MLIRRKRVEKKLKFFFGNVKKNLLSLHPLSEGRQQRKRKRHEVYQEIFSQFIES